MFQTILVPGHTDKGSKANLSVTFRARLDAAVTLAKEFKALIVIVSGKGPHETKTEAALGYDYLKCRLPAFTKILKEEYSNETIANYIFSTAAFIAPLRIARVVTVTSPEQSNRCHQIAQHLWGNRVTHSVFSAIPETTNTVGKSVKEILEKAQFEDLKRADFIADFLASTGVTLQDHLHWLCQNYEKWTMTQRYPSVLEVEEESKKGQLKEHGWGPLVGSLSNPESDLSKWWTRFSEQGTARRQIYRALFEDEGAGPDKAAASKAQLRRVALLSIAELGHLAERADNVLSDQQIGLILNYVPVKLYYCFEKTRDLEKVRKEDAHAFKKVLKVCLTYLKDSGRMPVDIWPGQGMDANSRAYGEDELQILLTHITHELK